MALSEVIPWQVRREGEDAETRYRDAIARGESERLAEIMALQQPPGISGTNDQFLRGKKNGEQFDMDKPFDKAVLEMYRQQALEAGVSIEGKYYFTRAADYPGDPRAWHASKEDLHAYLRSRKTWSGGQVEGEAFETEDTPYCVSDEIVDEEIEKLREQHPEAGRTEREYRDLQEEFRKKLSGSLYGR